MNNDPAPQHEISFQEFRRIMSRRKWTVFICLGVALGLAGVAMVALPPAYRVTARVLAQPALIQSTYGNEDPVKQLSVQAEAPPVQNQIELLTSVLILETAFQNAGVSIPPEALDPDAKNSPVTVKEVGISDAVDISVDLPNPDASNKVAHEIPNAFRQQLTRGLSNDFNRAVGYVTEKLDGEQKKLTQAVLDLGKFRNSHPIVAEGMSAGDQRTVRLSHAVGTYEQDLSNLENAKQKYVALVAQRKALPEMVPNQTSYSNVANIATEKIRIADLTDKLADSRSQFTEDSQFVKSFKVQLANEKKVLDGFQKTESSNQVIKNPNIPIFDQNVAMAKATYDGALAAVQVDAKTVQNETQQLQDYSKSEPTEQNMLNTIAIQTQTVTDLTKQLDELRVRNTASRDPVSELSYTVPVQVQPAPVKYTVIAVLVGLASGIMLALFKDKYDDRVFSMDQIYSISGIPPLGQLPSTNKTLALTSTGARNPLLENYRALRFNLDSFAEGRDPIKSVLVASPSGLEKRSDLSFNLAVEAATDQRVTILVDADLRNPKLHEQFGARLSPGLSDVLRGTVTLEEALQATSNSKLRFLSAGSPEEDPLQLLSSPAMEALHEELKATADVIIINSSSLLRHADARALAKTLDSVLFVARSGATKLAALRYCIDLLRRAKAPLLGIVLSESGGYSDIPYYGRD